MIALTECGTVTDIPNQWKQNAKWSWFMPWYGGSHASDDWWKATMNSDNIITR